MSIGEWLTPTLVKDFLIAAIGSAAGAWGGAWAAQLIAERAKEKEHLLMEIRLSNAAIELAQGMFSMAGNLKEQHILGLKERYYAQRAIGNSPGTLRTRNQDPFSLWGRAASLGRAMNLLPHLPLEMLREPFGAEFSPKKPFKSMVEFVAPWRPVGESNPCFQRERLAS